MKFVVRNVIVSEFEKLYVYVEKYVFNIDICGCGWCVDVFERKGGRFAGISYKEFFLLSGYKLCLMKEVFVYVVMIDDYWVIYFVDMKYLKGDVKFM